MDGDLTTNVEPANINVSGNDFEGHYAVSCSGSAASALRSSVLPFSTTP